MWATTPQTTITPFISISKLTPPPPPAPQTLSAVPTRWRSHRISATSEDVGGLGLAVLGASRSDPQTTTSPGSSSCSSSTSKQNIKPKREEPKKEEKGKEISGSDILRAMQKASARKAQISTNKRKQQQMKMKMNVSMNSREDPNASRVVDYDKVRPISVKSDWSTRLDDLQKRLDEFLSL